jgi:heme exporter protein D
MNHVYSIYKWTAYGGNYAKIIIDYIDSTNRNVTIRGAYQQRQGYNLLY